MSQQNNQRKSKTGFSKDGKKPGAMKKFHPLSSMNKPKFSFDTVMTSFLDHLLVLSSTNKNNMNDMVESMKAGTMITLARPAILVSNNPDADLKAAEDRAHAITMASQENLPCKRRRPTTEPTLCQESYYDEICHSRNGRQTEE